MQKTVRLFLKKLVLAHRYISHRRK